MAQGWQPRQAAAEQPIFARPTLCASPFGVKTRHHTPTTMLGNLANLRDTLELGGFSFENTRR